MTSPTENLGEKTLIESKPRMTLKKFFIIFSVASLILSGLLAAFTILSGIGDSWQAAATSFIVFIANLLVLVSFNARHQWLKYVQWVSIPIATVMQLIYIWGDSIATYGSCDENPVTLVWECTTTPWEVYSTIALSFWIIIATFSLLSFFSIAWKYIQKVTMLKITYGATFTLSLAGSVIIWSGLIMEQLSSMGDDGYVLLASAAWILALTGAVIVIIFSSIESKRFKQAEKDRELEQQQKLLQGYNNLAQQRFSATGPIKTIAESSHEVDTDSDAFRMAIRFEVRKQIEELAKDKVFIDSLRKTLNADWQSPTITPDVPEN